MNPLDEAREMDECDVAAELDAALKQIDDERKQTQIREWTEQYGLPSGFSWEDSKAWVDKRARELEERFDAWNRLKLRLFAEIDRRCHARVLAAGFSEEELGPHNTFPRHIGIGDPRLLAFREAMYDYREDEEAMNLVLKCKWEGGNSEQPPTSTMTEQMVAAVGSTKCCLGDEAGTMVWFGEWYSFSPNQALVIRKLWAAWEDETFDVSRKSLLREVDPVAPPQDLKTLFRPKKPTDKKVWNVLIVAGKRRGTCRLNDPNAPK